MFVYFITKTRLNVTYVSEKKEVMKEGTEGHSQNLVHKIIKSNVTRANLVVT